jgi:hypothetical protein
MLITAAWVANEVTGELDSLMMGCYPETSSDESFQERRAGKGELQKLYNEPP